MNKIDKNKVYWRKVEDETVILNIDSGFYYTLDGAGSTIWNMIINNKNKDQIVSNIANEYEIDDRTVKKDIETLFKNLEKEDLIEIK